MAQLPGSQVDFQEQVLKRALKQFNFHGFEGGLERIEQLVALDAGLMSNARLKIRRLNHIRGCGLRLSLASRA